MKWLKSIFMPQINRLKRPGFATTFLDLSLLWKSCLLYRFWNSHILHKLMFPISIIDIIDLTFSLIMSYIKVIEHLKIIAKPRIPILSYSVHVLYYVLLIIKHFYCDWQQNALSSKLSILPHTFLSNSGYSYHPPVTTQV